VSTYENPKVRLDEPTKPMEGNMTCDDCNKFAGACIQLAMQLGELKLQLVRDRNHFKAEIQEHARRETNAQRLHAERYHSGQCKAYAHVVEHMDKLIEMAGAEGLDVERPPKGKLMNVATASTICELAILDHLEGDDELALRSLLWWVHDKRKAGVK